MSSISHAWSSVWKAEWRIKNGRVLDRIRFGTFEHQKPAFFDAFTSDLTARFNAVELVRKGSEALGGKGGGGRPDMAQAGGPDGAKADAALSAIEQAMAGA